jgi:hypothetical protein
MYKHCNYSTCLIKTIRLVDAIDQDHLLIILAKKINWLKIKIGLSDYYAYNKGRPGYTIRLMVALQILKYIYKLSEKFT